MYLEKYWCLILFKERFLSCSSAPFNFMDLDGIPYVIYVWKHNLILNNFKFLSRFKKSFSVSKKNSCICSESMSVTALVPFLVMVPWFQSLFSCKWELLCRKADLEPARWYHFSSPVTWCPSGDGTQKWALWHCLEQQASSWRSYLGFEQIQGNVEFMFIHIRSHSMIKQAWWETKLVLLKEHLFSKCQLWKILPWILP